jgi:hypothetical protein
LHKDSYSYFETSPPLFESVEVAKLDPEVKPVFIVPFLFGLKALIEFNV